MDAFLRLISDYATALSYEDLPPEVIHQAKRRTIDALGCAMGGYTMDPPRIARDHAAETTSNPGATVIGTAHRTSPESAAFANGVMVRYLDFNDTLQAKEPGHPSDNIPAVLAAAEYGGADARTLITGIVLGYEVQGRLSEAGAIRDKGWDSVTYVAISTAAGAAKALGLSGQKIADAIALATTANVALNQTRRGALSMWKGCAAGNAGRNGVFAAVMARRGLTGPQEAFEGQKGFVRWVTGPIELPAFGGDGNPFMIEKCKYKYFPTDYEVQCAIHPALELHELVGDRVSEIDTILVDTYDLAVDVTADTPAKWDPLNRETADHSLPYVLSTVLTNGAIWLDAFDDGKYRDAGLLALMQKVRVRSNAAFTADYPDANCFRIQVTLRSGEEFVREIRYAKGHPKNPMSDAEIEAKFRRLSEPLLQPAQIRQALDRLWNLEDVTNLRDVLTPFDLTSKSGVARRAM